MKPVVLHTKTKQLLRLLAILICFQAIWGTGFPYLRCEHSRIGQQYFDYEMVVAAKESMGISTPTESPSDAFIAAFDNWDDVDLFIPSREVTPQASPRPSTIVVSYLLNYTSALVRVPYRPQRHRLV